jgi:hypothetical protein
MTNPRTKKPLLVLRGAPGKHSGFCARAKRRLSLFGLSALGLELGPEPGLSRAYRRPACPKRVASLLPSRRGKALLLASATFAIC